MAEYNDNFYIRQLSMIINDGRTGLKTRVQEYFNPYTLMISFHVILAVWNDNDFCRYFELT